ncbi:MAG: hypothetical protein IJA79_06150 [Desulfovibrio sp.]|nr:hypothetical protein [Desulfovibrio sp.]
MNNINMRYSENDMPYERELAIRQCASAKFMSKVYLGVAACCGVAAMFFVGFLLGSALFGFLAVRNYLQFLHTKTMFRLKDV